LLATTVADMLITRGGRKAEGQFRKKALKTNGGARRRGPRDRAFNDVLCIDFGKNTKENIS